MALAMRSARRLVCRIGELTAMKVTAPVRNVDFLEVGEVSAITALRLMIELVVGDTDDDGICRRAG